jgi:hypothetical protein
MFASTYIVSAIFPTTIGVKNADPKTAMVDIAILAPRSWT